MRTPFQSPVFFGWGFNSNGKHDDSPTLEGLETWKLQGASIPHLEII